MRKHLQLDPICGRDSLEYFKVLLYRDFGVNLLTLFSKLDSFSALANWYTLMKPSSLQNRMVNVFQKGFIGLAPSLTRI
jgi:hypothetical protein